MNFSGTNGSWSTVDRELTLGKWHHVAITYSGANVANDPTFYIDGKKVLLSEDTTPVGTAASDSDSDFILGNQGDDSATLNGRMAIFRIFK